MGNDDASHGLLPGTLEMLVLKTLTRGPTHGYGIAQHIQGISDDVFHLSEGSLYPALRRLLVKGWVTADWGVSENNRRARYYKLTPAGCTQLGAEAAKFARVAGAMARLMQTP